MKDAEHLKEDPFPPEGTLKVNHSTPAARYNAKILRQITSCLKENPEVDISTLIPSSYPQQLKLVSINPRKPKRRSLQHRDTRSLLRIDDKPCILSPLSEEVRAALDQILVQWESDEVVDTDNDCGSCFGDIGDNGDNGCQNESVLQSRGRYTGIEKSESLYAHPRFSAALLELLDRSDVIFRYPYGFSTMILRITDNVVAKVVRDIDGTTEYSALRYLQDNAPDIPVPRPHGLIRTGRYLLMFSSFIPGEDLDKIWPGLDELRKHNISSQIETIFTSLRALRQPLGKPLGGVGGEGCKDPRRDVRSSTKQIYTLNEFQEFVFSNPTSGSPVYIEVLKSFIPLADDTEMTGVFTHGDLRTANIRVEKAKDGAYKVTGILDWEYSGFYPEFWESLKITNTMMAFERSDWYLHLPSLLSPHNYPRRWLLDRIWDRLL